MQRFLKYLILAVVAQASAQEMTGREIIEKVNTLMNPKTSYARAQMTIVTSSGQNRTFVYDSWSSNYGEKNLIRYLEPSRLKGQATLMLNYADDIWMYFARTRRVRKMATHAKKQKMEGSDFSYEDMGAGNSFIEDFTDKRIGDTSVNGQDCYQVEMLRKPDADISYSKLVMSVRKDNLVPVRIEYYDEDNPDRMLKVLIQANIRNIQGIPTAMNMEMQNQSDKTKTQMEFIEIQYNLELDDNLFTERGLKQ